jgi:hypothetical protein
LSKEEVFFTEKAGISGKLRKAESGEEATGNYRIETLASRNSEAPANPLSLTVTVEIMKQPFQFRKYSTNYLLDFTDF